MKYVASEAVLGNLTRITRKKLGEMLINAGLLAQDQLEDCLNEQKRTGELLGDILVRRGLVSELNIAQTIATQYSLPYLSPKQYAMSPDIIQALPREFQEKCLVFPMDKFGNTLVVAAACPLSNEVVEEIQQVSGSSVQIYVGTPSDVREAIEKGAELVRRTVFTEATELSGDEKDVDRDELAALEAAIEKELRLDGVDVVQIEPGHAENKEDAENGDESVEDAIGEKDVPAEEPSHKGKQKSSRFGKGQ